MPSAYNASVQVIFSEMCVRAYPGAAWMCAVDVWKHHYAVYMEVMVNWQLT
jgi:hypothetical protein